MKFIKFNLKVSFIIIVLFSFIDHNISASQLSLRSTLAIQSPFNPFIDDMELRMQAIGRFKRDAAIIYFKRVMGRRDLRRIGITKRKLQELIYQRIADIDFTKPVNEIANINNLPSGMVHDQEHLIDDEGFIADEAKWGLRFINTVIKQAKKAKALRKKIIIGFDESWIPERQRGIIQRILTKLTNLSNDKDIDNVIFIRTNSAKTDMTDKDSSLAEQIRAIADKTGTPESNIIVFGSTSALADVGFHELRSGLDPEDWAFFAELDFTRELNESSYLKLLKMLTIAIDLAFDESSTINDNTFNVIQVGIRIFRFEIHYIEEYRRIFLRKIYYEQAELMI